MTFGDIGPSLSLAELESRFHELSSSDSMEVTWGYLAWQAELTLSTDEDPERTARLRYLVCAASFGTVMGGEEFVDYTLLETMVRSLDGLERCSTRTDYANQCRMMLGEVQFATGRRHAAHQSFETLGRAAVASEDVRVRARIRSAFVELATVARENAPSPTQSDEDGSDESGDAFFRSLEPSLHALRALRAEDRGALDAGTVAMLDHLVVDVGTLLQDTASLAPSFFEHVADALGANLVESHAASLEWASAMRRDFHRTPAEILVYVDASTLGEPGDATCTADNAQFVRSLYCAARNRPTDEAISELGACGDPGALLCEPDEFADQRRANAVIVRAGSRLRACVGANANVTAIADARTVRVRVSVDADGAAHVDLVHDARRPATKTCVANALAQLDLEDERPYLADAVELPLWNDATPLALDSIGGSDSNAPRTSPFLSGARGVMSITMDDDTLAHDTAPVP